MAPLASLRARETTWVAHSDWNGSWKHDLPVDGYVLESWSQGFLVGSLIMMMGITVANMARSVLLHKLIFIELLLAVFHGTFCFMSFHGYGYYLSSTATLLYASLYLHNIIAWLKTRPFLTSFWSRVYIITFLLTTPFWVVETYANFAFFNQIRPWFLKTRPLEALFRDPWWVFTTINLLYNIKKRYRFDLFELIRASPRFGIMLFSMFLSIVFVIVDVLYAVIGFGSIVGINPYWKFALVFKCFCDTLILDDFRSALEKIKRVAFRRLSDDPNAHRYPNPTKSTSPRKASFPHRSSSSAPDGCRSPMGNHVSIKSVPKLDLAGDGDGEGFNGVEMGKLSPKGTRFRLGSEDGEVAGGGGGGIFIRTDVFTKGEDAGGNR